ncbi:MAG: hypothetical protein [Microvirus sp.]|nr:MAG: hypothetical protein [Microvirus sp.]
MNSLHRQPVNKKHSSHKFGKSTQKTKAANMSPTPMRGGIRL